MILRPFRRSARIVMLLLSATVCGCSRAPDTRIPVQYGVVETVLGRQIVEQAILFVNLILPTDQPLRLQPTWPSVRYFPSQTFKRDTRQKRFAVTLLTDQGFDNGAVFINAETVPVFLIDGQSLGNVELAFVPDGCRCIFVNAHSLDDLFRMLYLTGRDAIEEHGDFDKAVALSLVLLHETGHLHFRDRSSYATNARLDIAEINEPSRAISNPEVRADAFASEVVRLAWSSGEMRSPFLGPYGRAAIASNIFRVLATGFNTYDVRHDPQGILGGKPHYEMFRSNGYSHLNLYLRLLIFLQQSEPTAERRRYIELIEHASTDRTSSK